MTSSRRWPRSSPARGGASRNRRSGARCARRLARATADCDLLIVDAACLDVGVWEELSSRGARVEVRAGDLDDPLAGVIRISRPGAGAVDVIVGRSAWQRDLLARSELRPIGGAMLPVVRAADLVLLKLYAGGPQDAWDIDRLLQLDASIPFEVEARLGELPADCGELWRRIRAGR